ncbi:MAG: hypothetical protein K6U87_05975 [Firmicutes bacterium]|nr:hypothetical protein [Bacillota bacterium]
MAVQIRLFGDMTVETDTGQIYTGRRPFLVLLAYLALHPSRPIRRETLAFTLWPDSTEVQARANLRKTLFLLRKTCPTLLRTLTITPSYVACDKSRDVWCDYWEFQQRLQEGCYAARKAAVAVYRGELLSHWDDEWIIPLRESIHQRYQQALQGLIQTSLRLGRPLAAAHFAEILYQSDPLLEESLRLLVQAYLQAGDPAQARQRFAEGSALLRRELGPQAAPEMTDFDRWVQAEAPPLSLGGRPLLDSATAAPLPPGHPPWYVGRRYELEQFRSWLTEARDGPPVLVVQGPGGRGKTTLLHRFVEEASSLDIPAILVDARTLGGSAELLLAQLGHSDWDAAIAYLNRARPVLLFDTGEELGPLRSFLCEQLLPRLDPQVRWVFAGRFEPSIGFTLLGERRLRATRVLGLRPFAQEEAEAYLKQRGLTDPIEAGQIMAVAGGSPLVLSVAADLATEGGMRDHLVPPAKWQVTVHALAGYLLREIPEDPTLQVCLEAATVVRQCSETVLTILTQLPDLRPAFRHLAKLSVVQPTEMGLALQDDVRAILGQDLRWRNPERWEELRGRAMAYYQECLLHATDPLEQTRMLEELLFLTHERFVHALLFPPIDPTMAWLEPATAAHHHQLRRLWADWLDRELGGELVKEHMEALNQSLEHPAVRMRVVQDRDGSLRGFNGVIPLCQETVPILRQCPNTNAFLEARFSPTELQELPQPPEAAEALHLRFAVFSTQGREAVRALLLRDILSLFARNRRYFVTTSCPLSQRFLERLQFARIPRARWDTKGVLAPFESYELDLSRAGHGFSTWARSLVQTSVEPAIARDKGTASIAQGSRPKPQ